MRARAQRVCAGGLPERAVEKGVGEDAAGSAAAVGPRLTYCGPAAEAQGRKF